MVGQLTKEEEKQLMPNLVCKNCKQKIQPCNHKVHSGYGCVGWLHVFKDGNSHNNNRYLCEPRVVAEPTAAKLKKINNPALKDRVFQATETQSNATYRGIKDSNR
jgi:hypothetical protein